MKVLHVITSLKIGGAEQALCNILALLRHRKNDHHVAYFYDGPHVQTLRALSIPTYKISGLVHHYDPFAYYQLKTLIRRLQPDVIHTSLWSANVIGRLIGRQLGIPVVSDLHGNCTHEGFIRNFFDRLTAPMAHTIVAVSPSVEQAYKIKILASIARKPHLMVIKNSINSTYLHEQATAAPLERIRLGIPHNAFVVGAIGRLEPIKSYDVLIRGFAHWLTHYPYHHDRTLVLVGDGSQASTLKQLTNDLKIASNIIFTGARMDVYSFYPLFDCFALSSQSEGLSLALLEAMTFGLPILSTCITPEHDVIKDGVNGFLVPPNNPEAIALALQRFIDDHATTQLMKTRNRSLIAEQFQIENVVDRYASLFTSLQKSP